MVPALASFELVGTVNAPSAVLGNFKDCENRISFDSAWVWNRLGWVVFSPQCIWKRHQIEKLCLPTNAFCSFVEIFFPVVHCRHSDTSFQRVIYLPARLSECGESDIAKNEAHGHFLLDWMSGWSAQGCSCMECRWIVDSVDVDKQAIRSNCVTHRVRIIHWQRKWKWIVVISD